MAVCGTVERERSESWICVRIERGYIIRYHEIYSRCE